MGGVKGRQQQLPGASDFRAAGRVDGGQGQEEGQMVVEVAVERQDRFVEHVGNPWGFPNRFGKGKPVRGPLSCSQGQ